MSQGTFEWQYTDRVGVRDVTARRFGFSGSDAQADETVLHPVQHAGRHEVVSEQGSQHTQLHPRQLYSVSSVYSYVRRSPGPFPASFTQ